MIIVPQSAKLLAHTADPEILLEQAGRTCYRSEDKITGESAPKFVEMICRRHHMSVLEHAVATIRFTTDRGIAQELTRHRICSYSMESTRYVNYHKKGQIRVVCPLGLTEQQHAIWTRRTQQAEDAYNELVEAGCTPEVARDVLPLDLACDIVVTTNFRQWLTMVSQRIQPAAHPKIRALIGAARDLLVGISPTVFKKEVPM